MAIFSETAIPFERLGRERDLHSAGSAGLCVLTLLGMVVVLTALACLGQPADPAAAWL